MLIRHYLQPLLAPQSVALVGASEREGALGNIVYCNLAAGFSLELFAVNPKYRSVQGKPAYARLTQLPKAPDLAVIAVPARVVPQVIADCGAAGIRAAAVLTSGFGEAGEHGKKLQEEMRAGGQRRGIRRGAAPRRERAGEDLHAALRRCPHALREQAASGRAPATARDAMRMAAESRAIRSGRPPGAGATPPAR